MLQQERSSLFLSFCSAVKSVVSCLFRFEFYNFFVTASDTLLRVLLKLIFSFSRGVMQLSDIL